MIRFVDLTGEDEGDPPGVFGKRVRSCAFLDTVTDTFVQAADGCHVFRCFEDFPEGATGDRCQFLVPPGFFG